MSARTKLNAYYVYNKTLMSFRRNFHALFCWYLRLQT